MIPLDTLLPEIERAVTERVESKMLASMTEGELRDLVYKIVERQRTPTVDPIRHLAELVNAAKERHHDLVDAKEHSVNLRKAVLEDLLEHVQPALPALLGSIVVETHHGGVEESRKHHPLLLGLELVAGRRASPNGTSQIYTGKSFWIVGLQPEALSDPIYGRYAIAYHHGKTSNGVGRTGFYLELISCAEAAEQIREDQFRAIVSKIVDRLLVAAGQKDPKRGPRGGATHKKDRGDIVKHTDSLWKIAETLQAALEVMKEG